MILSKRLLFSAVALGAFAASSVVNAGFMIDVIPSYAPNGQVSPNWSGYVSNAITGIGAGGVDTGAGTRDSNPAKYEVVTGPVSPSEMIFTAFPSWRGTAAPNPVFTGNAAVAGEGGNRIHFGTHIKGTDGMRFSLHDVSWSLDSDDADDFFDQTGDFSTSDYSSARVGVDYGADMMAGTGDDFLVTSGSGSTMVDELIYVGVGEGFPSENIAVPTDQADIDLTLAAIFAGCDGCDVTLKAAYMVGGDMGMEGITIAVPEPSSILIAMGGMLLGVVSIRRRLV